MSEKENEAEALAVRLMAYRSRNEWGGFVQHDICDEAASLLRSQAERIAELEKPLPTLARALAECGEHDMRSLVRENNEQRDRIAKMVELLDETRKGIDMIHDGLMDPTRPRQSVGEVAAYWLARVDTALRGEKEKASFEECYANPPEPSSSSAR